MKKITTVFCFAIIALFFFAASFARAITTAKGSREVFPQSDYVFPQSSVCEDSALYFLDGEFIQVLDYVYTINASRKEDGTADMVMCVLPSFTEEGYRQEILFQEIDDFPNASYVQEHEDYVEFEWSDAPESVLVRRAARIGSTTEYRHFVTSSPFPVEEQLFSIDISPYLRRETSIQIDDPEIERMSQNLTTGSLCQMDAVGRVLNWVRANIGWACTTCMLEKVGFAFSDASNTLEYRLGNCNNMANLAVALLRAAGIPSVRSGGFVADRPYSSTGHVWIAVLYPDVGWIEYESSYWMPTGGLVPTTVLMPQHVTFDMPPKPSMGISFCSFEEFHEANWTIVSSPQKVCKVVRKVDNGEILVFPLVAEFQDFSVLVVNWSAPPSNWRIASSLNILNLSKTGTETFFFTIATPETGDVDGTITVTLSTLDGTQVGEVLIQHVHEFLETDLNKDGTVNILDISIVAMAFGSTPEDPDWNVIADLNNDQIINILDLSTVAIEFGKTV